MDQRRNKKLEYIDKFLGKYAQIQLWVFVTSMVIVAILYMANPEAYTYEIVSADNESLQLFAENLNISIEGEPIKSISMERISSVKADELQKKYNHLAWLTFICIIGSFLSQREKRDRMKELYTNIKRKIK